LRTYPHIRLWVTGCGAADDAYALSILLREADLAHRSRIYATDTSELAMGRARAGAIGASGMEEYEHLYRLAGGTRSFTDYVVWTNNAKTVRMDHPSFVHTGGATLKISNITIDVNTDKVHLGDVEGGIQM